MKKKVRKSSLSLLNDLFDYHQSLAMKYIMHNIDNDIIHINENVNNISDIFDTLEIMTIFLRKKEKYLSL